ncbi:hypothetical protein FNF28_02701 [Cafeteria roenbergensis]|uniref:Uncharacterized protein n=1 Tax=Cafeteria roenbergensis TaxID=33653 RepID=A0A5A8DQJ0_CAFRO|nr:hypothetical protein FNF28_02701 [Cafeteria roenbergensis]
MASLEQVSIAAGAPEAGGAPTAPPGPTAPVAPSGASSGAEPVAGGEPPAQAGGSERAAASDALGANTSAQPNTDSNATSGNDGESDPASPGAGPASESCQEGAEQQPAAAEGASAPQAAGGDAGPADPSPDTDQDAPGGGDSAAAAVVSAVPASNAENGWRVKVYRLHDQDGTWESLGIGRIRDKAHSTLAPGEEWAIDVEEEDSTGAPSGERWLLHCPVQAPEDYKRQDGTIITWNEQPTNVDLALSFQEDVGCGRVWQDIQDVGRAARADGRLQMGFVHSDGSGMFGSVQRALDGSSDSAMDLLSDTAESLYPNQAFRRRGVGMLGASRHLGSESDDDCEPDIERLRRAVMAVTPATLTSVCNRIISEAGLSHDPVCTALARKGFGALDAFLAAVLGAEEEGNLEALHSAHSALSQIMSVADRDIVERCCAPHRFLALAAVCEYDPALPVRPRHRLHLLTRATLVQAMSPDVPELSRRAHLLFRISFFQNVLAPHMAEDTLPATLNQLADACRAEIVSAVTDMPHLTSAMISLVGRWGEEDDAMPGTDRPTTPHNRLQGGSPSAECRGDVNTPATFVSDSDQCGRSRGDFRNSSSPAPADAAGVAAAAAAAAAPAGSSAGAPAGPGASAKQAGAAHGTSSSESSSAGHNKSGGREESGEAVVAGASGATADSAANSDDQLPSRSPPPMRREPSFADFMSGPDGLHGRPSRPALRARPSSAVTDLVAPANTVETGVANRAAIAILRAGPMPGDEDEDDDDASLDGFGAGFGSGLGTIGPGLGPRPESESARQRRWRQASSLAGRAMDAAADSKPKAADGQSAEVGWSVPGGGDGEPRWWWTEVADTVGAGLSRDAASVAADRALAAAAADSASFARGGSASKGAASSAPSSAAKRPRPADEPASAGNKGACADQGRVAKRLRAEGDCSAGSASAANQRPASGLATVQWPREECRPTPSTGLRLVAEVMAASKTLACAHRGPIAHALMLPPTDGKSLLRALAAVLSDPQAAPLDVVVALQVLENLADADLSGPSAPP